MGQRRLADGLRGVGVIVKVEVTGSVDRSVALGQVQGEGLALLNVPQDQALLAQIFFCESGGHKLYFGVVLPWFSRFICLVYGFSWQAVD